MHDIQRRWESGERSDKKYVKPIGRQATMTWISLFGSGLLLLGPRAYL